MATGTRLMQEISDQFLNCKICFENFREPKTLSCLHTFCCDCLQQQYDSELNARSSRYALYCRGVTCPLCRKKTELPTGGVRRLPDNFLVSNLTNVLAKKIVTKIPPCDICQSARGKMLEARSKCLDCNKLLCKSCVDMHTSTKVTHKHSLVDVLGDKTSIECKEHPEETIRFYCEPCECCICVVCTFQQHKDHDVCSLADGFNKHKYTLDELLDRSRQRVEIVTARLQSVKKYETVITGVKEKIRDLAISHIAQIRNKERELLNRIEDVYGDKLKELMENKPVMEENVEELQNACNLTDIVLKDKGVELLILKKELESKMSYLLSLSLPEVPEKYDVTFEPGENTLGTLVFGGSNNINDYLKDGIIRDELKKPQNKLDLISNSTQTESTRCLEQNTSMNADMNIRTSTTSLQTDMIFSDIEDLYKKISDLESKEAVSKTSESTPPPDLLPPWTYTPGRWIRSRKIQTDICSLDFSREMSDREYVHTLLVMDSFKANKKNEETRSKNFKDQDTPVRRMSNASTMTNGVSLLENEGRKRKRDVGINVVCDSVHENTQTPIKHLKDSTSSTDGCGMIDKCTSTSSNKLIDKETATNRIYLEDRCTYTETTPTSDRATSTVGPKMQSKAISTITNKSADFGVQVLPDSKSFSTNTVNISTTERDIQTSIDVVETGTDPDSKIEKQTNTPSVQIESSVDDVRSLNSNKAKATMCDRASDAIRIQSFTKATETQKIKTISTASGTVTPKYVERETSTNLVKTIDQWTETLVPQMVSTGVTPPRPATLDVGVSTVVVNTNDEATCTEVKSYRNVKTETVLVVCDNETLTDKPISVDAQTSVEISTDSTETEVKIGPEIMETNTDDASIKTYEHQFTQCNIQNLEDFEIKIAKCSHTDPELNQCKTSLDQTVSKDINNGSRGTVASHGTATVLSQITQPNTQVPENSSSSHQETAVQTHSARVLDKSLGTSFEYDGDFFVRTLSKEFKDVATSTESLPYIGLLSEIDVDDMVVIPETSFDLVSDSESEHGVFDIEMVDSETCTEYLQYVETGTQTTRTVSEVDRNNSEQEFNTEMTNSQRSNGKGIGEVIRTMVESVGGISNSSKDGDRLNSMEIHDINLMEHKHLVSIGVNTVPKMTFEKETCTPLRHLYSKGTMTLCVTKLDKSKTTPTPSDSCNVNKLTKTKSVDKITMTTSAEQKDIGVMTEKTEVDGRIGDCISKLRNLSEKLNSPTSRKPAEASFFENTSNECSSISENSTRTGDTISNNRTVHNTESIPLQQSYKLETHDTNKVKKSTPSPIGDTKTVRKPQPITTLKGRKPAPINQVQDIPQEQPPNTGLSKDEKQLDSKSLPRQFTLNRPRPVKMGSQPLSSNRTPDKMTTVTPHTITTKPVEQITPKKHSCTSSSPISSPNKTSNRKKHTRIEKPTSPPPPEQKAGTCTKIPCSPDDVWIKKPHFHVQSNTNKSTCSTDEDNNTQSSKPKVRQPLPSITESRNSSTGSNTPMNSSMSSNFIASTIEHQSLVTSSIKASTSSSAHPKSTDTSKTRDSKTSTTTFSSQSSAMSSSLIISNSESLTDSVFKNSTDTLNSAASSETLEESTPQKKSGKGFMQRFLPKRKKNQEQSKDQSSSVSSTSAAPSASNLVGKALAGATLIPHASSHTNMLQPELTQNVPKPESKSPMTSRKARPFVYVRQKIFSIQQDNVDEANEKKSDRGSDSCSSAASLQKVNEISVPQVGKATEKDKSDGKGKQATLSTPSQPKEKVKSKEGKGKKCKKSESSKSKKR